MMMIMLQNDDDNEKLVYKIKEKDTLGKKKKKWSSNWTTTTVNCGLNVRTANLIMWSLLTILATSFGIMMILNILNNRPVDPVIKMNDSSLLWGPFPKGKFWPIS